MNYYNDNDPFVAKWLKNLVTAGHLPAGDVDERSITEVTADDLKGYRQVHFFAGIGGWPLALRLAGWPDDRPVWTGSCPCQPLSSAGRQRGHADERHLWPAFQRLIAECLPTVVFGEQVGSRDGREWLAAVRLDLESLGYACGATDLPAAGVGAPHIRQRLWWVADAGGERRQQVARSASRHERANGREPDEDHIPTGHGENVGLGYPNEQRPQGRRGGLGEGPRQRTLGEAGYPSWEDLEWIACADGKARPAQPGIHPLSDGIPGRVGQLRAYGNAIVPPLAAVFIKASMEAMKEAT